MQPNVQKAQAALDAKTEEQTANQSQIDEKVEAKDRAKAANDVPVEDDMGSLFGDDDEDNNAADADGDVTMDVGEVMVSIKLSRDARTG